MGRLFWKILFTFWLTLLIASIAAGATVWLHQRDWNDEELLLRPSSALAVQAAASTYRFGGAEALRALLQEQENSAQRFARVYAVDDAGEELLGRSVLPSALQRARSLAEEDVLVSAVRLTEGPAPDYLLFVPRPEQVEGRSLRPMRRSGQLVLISGLAISFVSSFLLTWYFARPVRLLREALRALATGDLTRRIGSAIGGRRDELADLARDFDHTAARLEALVESQRRLLHDVSHELRSPLARLNVSVGLARQQPDTTSASLDRIEQEVERLDQLVGEILTLARLEAGVAAAREDYVDLVDLLETVVENARFESQGCGREVRLICNLEQPLTVRGQGELLYRAIENVVRNALAHTHAGTEVILQAERDAEQIRITVDDEGPGVPPGQEETLFEAFYTTGKQASVQGGGVGLGLAIARRAIESHAGTIRALNRVPRGLRVEIRLPTSLLDTT